jgi:2-polyprenyl-3-methyl-5-hydroxy-6-metoxy-1,4-benzoquinol methylase
VFKLQFCKIKKIFKSYNQVNYVICKECGCHYQNPVIKTDYSKSYWQVSSDPDGVKRNFQEERVDKIKNFYGNSINLINKNKNIKVLDVGCGMGFFLSSLNSTIEKYGIEESQYAVDFIKNNFKDIIIKKGNINDVYNLKLNFDVIMFYHVIEHLESPSKSIEILKNKLNNKGLLILGTPNIGSFFSKFFGGNYRNYNPQHLCLYNLGALRLLMEKNNFYIEKIEKPFFGTKYNNFNNFFRLFNPKKISPPFYNSIVTLYLRKRI